MRTCILLMILLLVRPLLHAQDLTKLLAEAETPAGITQLRALNQLAIHYLSSSSGKAIAYATRSTERATELKTSSQGQPGDAEYSLPAILRCEADAYNCLGQAHEKAVQKNSALRSYRIARRIATEIGYPEAQVVADQRIAVLEGRPGTFSLPGKIEQVMTKVESGVKKAGTDVIAPGFEELGKQAEGSGDYPKAIDYYQKALPYYANAGDTAHAALLRQKITTLSAALTGKPVSPLPEVRESPSGTAPPKEPRSSEDPVVLAPSQEESDARQASDEYRLRADKLARAGRYRESLESFQKYTELQSVVHDLENKRKEDELKITLQNQIIEKNAQRLRFLVAIAVLLLTLSLLAAWLYLTRRKAHRQLSNTYHDLEQTHLQLKMAQSQLVSSEKMASLGQLTAGIAHEINNPINFISGNIQPLRDNISDLMRLLEKYETTVRERGLSTEFADVERLRQSVEADLIRNEIPALISGMEEGANRSAEIVRGLRNFARMDEDVRKPVDIPLGLDTTLALLKNRLRGIEVLRDYGDVSEVEGFPGRLNQVFMNVLDNAVQAMPGGGIIYIQTQTLGDKLEIRIRDTGQGMSEEVRLRIFEPFFTTKEVGVGTGLGMSISLGIIMQHQGHIDVKSVKGQGTEVVITLPMKYREETVLVPYHG